MFTRLLLQIVMQRFSNLTMDQINDDGTGITWTQVSMTSGSGVGLSSNLLQMTVTQQVPGTKGNEHDGAETDFVSHDL